MVKMHPYIESKLQSLKLGTHLHYLPMLHPPKPWVNPQSGGYLTIKQVLCQQMIPFKWNY